MGHQSLSPPEGHIIDMSSQEKASRPNSAHPHLPTEKPTRARRILLAFALGLTVLLVVHSVPTQLWKLSCHGETTREMFQKHFSEKPEAEQQPVDVVDVPRLTTPLHLARRQDDNTTASSAPPTSTTSTSTSTTATTSTSSSSSSSSSPPARNDGSTTTTSSSTSSTSTNNRADPASTSSSTVVGGGSPSNTGTSTSGPSQNTRAASLTTVTLSDAGVITTLVTDESRTPSTLNGGSTLTRSTTLPQTSAAPRTSKMVIETLTSTLSNGNVVVVTKTTYVPPDPVMTTQVTTTSLPSLHSSASRHALGDLALVAIAGILLGMVLI